MRDCDRALELLSARLDGALTQPEEKTLAQHLAHCPDCGAAAHQLDTLRQALPLLEEEVPQGFHQRLMQKIGEERVVPFPAPRSGGRVWKNWLSTAAVFALLILGGSGLLRSGPELLRSDPEAALPQEAGLPLPRASSQPDVFGSQGAEVTPQDQGPRSTPAPQTGTTPAPMTGATPRPTTPPVETDNSVTGKTTATPPPTVQTIQETPRPEIGVRIINLPTPAESAALNLAAARWPDGTASLLHDTAGALTGVQVDTEAGETVTLTCLGLSANGRYYQFCPPGQEENPLAVAVDGSVILERQTAPEDYDVSMGQVAD